MTLILLTSTSCRVYSSAQVLNTLHKAECPAPDSRGFFSPIVFNSRVVGNDKILEKSGKVASRLCAVFKYLAASLNRRQILNKSQRRPVMAANTQDASASSKESSHVIPEDLIVIIDLKGWDITEYHGTKAMLESEGIIPEGFEWPEGYNDVYWKDDQFDYWLRRHRPEGAKGSRKQFANVDWFKLRWNLIDTDPLSRELARKAKELKDLIYRNSSEGFAENEALWSRYSKAQQDKQFQTFKAKIPCLATTGRDRKSSQANIKNASVDALRETDLNPVEENNNADDPLH
ncbi:hypothetical protein [Nitrosomonas sp. Is79A3]|uniref:hypothetical protein n=1 Tax=Nitrosomonas sp. (strain Is79A3) TaxID=261292 RepID=UPI0002F8B843